MAGTRSYVGGADAVVLVCITNTSTHRDACRVVRIPDVEQEDARRVHRERERLVREPVQHVNRIKGLCATQGICGA
jgi:transposase